jgi:hypothetical protein
MSNVLLAHPNVNEIILFLKESSPLKESGLMTLKDKFILHKIAKSLPSGSIVVEIGTFLGASASLMAHSNPLLEVHTYDLFNDHIHDVSHGELIAKILGTDKSRSLENVSNYLSRYPNIHLHKVNPFEEIIFDKHVDMFIEDSSHKDPQLTNSINYWLPKIKVNGFMLLHDYRPWLPMDHRFRFIDVDNQVEKLSKSDDWHYLGNFSCFAIFQRIK